MVLDIPAYNGKEPYAFVSYAHKNADVVTCIMRKLYAAGLRMWYDDGIEGVSVWDDRIAKAVLAADYFIVMMSKEYLASDNCKDELSYARDKGKTILVIYLDDSRLSEGLEMRLNRRQALFLKEYRNTDDFIAKVLESDGIDACVGDPTDYEVSDEDDGGRYKSIASDIANGMGMFFKDYFGVILEPISEMWSMKPFERMPRLYKSVPMLLKLLLLPAILCIAVFCIVVFGRPEWMGLAELYGEDVNAIAGAAAITCIAVPMGICGYFGMMLRRRIGIGFSNMNVPNYDIVGYAFWYVLMAAGFPHVFAAQVVEGIDVSKVDSVMYSTAGAWFLGISEALTVISLAIVVIYLWKSRKSLRFE